MDKLLNIALLWNNISLLYLIYLYAQYFSLEDNEMLFRMCFVGLLSNKNSNLFMYN